MLHYCDNKQVNVLTSIYAILMLILGHVQVNVVTHDFS